MDTNRRRFKPICQTATVLLAFGLITSLLPGLAAAGTTRPNIVFIFTDDQRFDAIGVADEAMATPNLDRLAARGTRFANAFVTLSICSDRRARSDHPPTLELPEYKRGRSGLRNLTRYGGCNPMRTTSTLLISHLLAPLSGLRAADQAPPAREPVRLILETDLSGDGVDAKGNPLPGSIEVSINPGDYQLTAFHLNAETHFQTAPAEPGWSMRNLRIEAVSHNGD